MRFVTVNTVIVLYSASVPRGHKRATHATNRTLSGRLLVTTGHKMVTTRHNRSQWLKNNSECNENTGGVMCCFSQIVRASGAATAKQATRIPNYEENVGDKAKVADIKLETDRRPPHSTLCEARPRSYITTAGGPRAHPGLCDVRPRRHIARLPATRHFVTSAPKAT